MSTFKFHILFPYPLDAYCIAFCQNRLGVTKNSSGISRRRFGSESYLVRLIRVGLVEVSYRAAISNTHNCPSPCVSAQCAVRRGCGFIRYWIKSCATFLLKFISVRSPRAAIRAIVDSANGMALGVKAESTALRVTRRTSHPEDSATPSMMHVHILRM